MLVVERKSIREKNVLARIEYSVLLNLRKKILVINYVCTKEVELTEAVNGDEILFQREYFSDNIVGDKISIMSFLTSA